MKEFVEQVFQKSYNLIAFYQIVTYIFKNMNAHIKI